MIIKRRAGESGLVRKLSFSEDRLRKRLFKREAYFVSWMGDEEV